MQHNNRPHPHVYTGPISPNGRSPFDPSPADTYTPYAFEVDLPGGYMVNPWEDDTTAPNTAHPSDFGNGIGLDMPARPRSRTRSVFEQPTEYLAFPEPQIYRSSSQRVTSTSYHPLHRNSKSDTGPLIPVETGDIPFPSPRGASPASSYYPNDEVCSLLIQFVHAQSLLQFDRSNNSLSAKCVVLAHFIRNGRH